MILKCNCYKFKQTPAAKYQDNRYGHAMRVHTPCKGPNGERLGRCTVCSMERPAGAGQ